MKRTMHNLGRGRHDPCFFTGVTGERAPAAPMPADGADSNGKTTSPNIEDGLLPMDGGRLCRPDRPTRNDPAEYMFAPSFAGCRKGVKDEARAGGTVETDRAPERTPRGESAPGAIRIAARSGNVPLRRQ